MFETSEAVQTCGYCLGKDITGIDSIPYVGYTIYVRQSCTVMSKFPFACFCTASFPVPGVAGMCVSPSLLFPRTHIPRDACFPAHISLMH